MDRREEIAEIKRNIRIKDIAELLGLKRVKGYRRGIGYVSPTDYKYNLVVYENTEKGDYFIDYGSGEKGSIIDFWMHITGDDYASTMRELRKILHDDYSPNGYDFHNKEKINNFNRFRDIYNKLHQTLHQSIFLQEKERQAILDEIMHFLEQIEKKIGHMVAQK